MKTRTPLFRIDRLLLAALALLAAPQAQAQLYTGTNSTGFWNTSRWSTATNGPFSSSWTANSASLFKAGTGTYTFTGANNSGAVNVGNITLEDNVAVNFSGASGTLSGGGVVRTISVGSGSTLDFGGTQAFSTATGNGWIKTGSGVLALSGGAFTNGFTLDGGVVVMRGADAMGAGSGNILTLSNGIVAASATRSLANTKYGGGIRIYGNITFGALTNVTTLSSATANISFANNVDLGGSTRTLTIGGNGNYEFSGVMSNGGLTVAAAAGATGNLTLSGANTYTGNTTINSGTVVLSGSGTAGATNSDLEVAGGLLNLSAGTKTNATFTLSGGTITNGTLQATTYALQGGSVHANLSTGTATVTAGTTTLNGTLGATTVNVNSGALNLGAADRLANGAAVTIAGGTLGLGANNDTVGAFTISSGILGGSGTLTAASYSLQGGTITANLGSGAATSSTGTTTLNGALAATTVDVASGTLTAGSAGRFTGTPTVTVSNGATLNLAGNETFGSLAGAGSVSNSAGRITAGGNNTSTTFSGVLSGAGELTKTGIGRLSLSGSSSYNGATAVSAGELNLSGGSIASSAVTVASGASLSGYGSVGTIGGAGAINPGNSPGILTTPQVNPSGETDFNLEMTGTAPTYNNAASSVNDVIRITGAIPFSQALAVGNGVNIYFSGAALFNGSTAVQYQGGFFTDESASFASTISGATYTYYFANASGTNSYNGANYYNKAQSESLILGTNMLITVSTVAQTANFGGGNIAGQVMQFQVIPEPSTYALLGLSAAAFGAYRWRRRHRG